MSRGFLPLGAVLLLAAGALALSGTPSGQGWKGPAAVVGGPVARLLSRMLSDQAEDAFHGGAKQDVKFVPKTPMGKAVQRLAGGRGEYGGGGRQKSDDAAHLAYSDSVKSWLAFAFKADPSNFNAFFIYYNYLVEGYRRVEIGGDEGGGHGQDEPRAGGHSGADHVCLGHGEPDGVSAYTDDRRGDLEEAKAALVKYLRSSRLDNSLECYNAAVGIWMFFENSLERGTVANRPKFLADVRRKMGCLISLGDSIGNGRGNPDDTAQARQYADAILARVEERLNRP